MTKNGGGGVSSARNEALKLAGGEYCLNVDSDDWIEQGYLKEIYEKAKNENLDMLISDAIFDCETEGKKELKKDLNIKENEVLTGKEYLKIFFSKNFHGYTWNKLIKREYYNRHNIYYDEKIFLYEDVEVVSMLALHMNRIGKLNKAYYHYVRGENNGSRKVKFKNYLDIERCFEKIREYYSKNNVDSELIELLRFREEYSLLQNLLFVPYVRDKIYIEKVRKCLSEIKIIKNYPELVEAKSVNLFLKLEKRVTKLKSKIMIFESIKKLHWIRSKLK